MTVKVKNWNGKNKDAFIGVVEKVFADFKRDVFLDVPHKQTVKPKTDENVYIFIWSCPQEVLMVKPPQKIWDIPVHCRDEAFTPSGRGEVIRDEGSNYAIAEVLNDNIFIHHDICHNGSEEELELFRQILELAKKHIPSEQKWDDLSLDRKIKYLLEKDFIYSESMARLLSLSFTSGKNAIVFGSGGHGKSAMTKAVIEGLGLGEETFFQFFGEGMDEARLFGGLNFRKLEEEKVLEYYPEKSFLNYRIAVFEELFDAPSSVLLALKDTLTAKELRNGDQRFPMKTESIIVLTNKDPDEVSELGPAAHALVERFPFHLDLKWPDYSTESYLRMFEKVAKRLEGPELNGSKKVLAEILAKATSEGNFISPRTAVHAYEAIQTSAKMRGADEVCHEDFVDLRFIVGLEDLGESLLEDIKASKAKARAEERLSGLEQDFRKLDQELSDTKDPIKALQLAKKFNLLEDKLSNVSVPDSLVRQKEGLREMVSEKISSAKKLALETTEI